MFEFLIDRQKEENEIKSIFPAASIDYNSFVLQQFGA